MTVKTFLYVKTHLITGLKYFGKTTRDPLRYRGSGKYWLRHIRTHGNYVTTEIIGEFTNINDLVTAATTFSIEHNIVQSSGWANLIVENGLDGAPLGNVVLDTTKAKISKALTGRLLPKSRYHMIESSDIRRQRSKLDQQNRIWITNGINDTRILKHLDIPTGWYRGRSKKENLKPPRRSNPITQQGKKIYNNGIIHRYFYPNNVSPDFVPGRIEGRSGGRKTNKDKEI